MKEVPTPHRFVDKNSTQRTVIVPDEKPLEECGLFSIYAPDGMTDAEARKLFKGAEGIQQRGQQGAGITAHALNGASFIYRGSGLLKDALPQPVQDRVADMSPLLSVSAQARYSTDGGFEKENLHPIELDSYEVMANGNFANKEELQRKSGKTYTYAASDTRIWTDTLPTVPGETQDDKIVNAVHGSVGAASLIINVGDETQYIARDRKGVRPLIVGHMDGELGPIYVVASETKAFDLIDATVDRDVRPGEVVRFDRDGMTVLEKGDKTQERMCSIEYAYINDADSLVNVTSNGAAPETWRRTADHREDAGRQLAREDKARDIDAAQKAKREGREHKPFKPDVVIGMPQSGIPSGKGYAKEMGAPYMQLIEKDPDVIERMFQADDKKDERKAGILKKVKVITPEGWSWEGKDVVIDEDSMVRGDAAATMTEVFNELGARVHMRIAFPKIVNPCHLGVNMRTHNELIAYRTNGDEQKIAQEIGAASVAFISPRGFAEAVQGDHFEPADNPVDIFEKNRMCGGCVTGEYPYPREGTIPLPIVDVR